MIPYSALALWRLTRLRILAGRLGVQKISDKGRVLEISGTFDLDKWQTLNIPTHLEKYWKLFPNKLTAPCGSSDEENLTRLEKFIETVIG